MSTLGEVVLGILMAVGLVGILLPVIPGLVLIVGVAVFWASQVGGVGAWALVGFMAVVAAAGTWIKYQVPGRELAAMDLSAATWVLAVVGGIIGFFVIPVVGLLLGGVLGVYLGQRRDHGDHAAAWASTRRVLGGVGKGIAIEFATGFVVVATWVVAVVLWL